MKTDETDWYKILITCLTVLLHVKVHYYYYYYYII